MNETRCLAVAFQSSRTVGYFVVPAVGSCHDKVCVSGSVVAFSVPCDVDARMAASVFAISGSILDV